MIGRDSVSILVRETYRTRRFRRNLPERDIYISKKYLARFSFFLYIGHQAVP